MRPVLTATVLAATAALLLAEEKPASERVRDAAAGAADKTKEVAREATDALVGAAHKVASVSAAAW